MIRESRGISITSLALCAFLWSSGGILIKLVSWDPFAIAGGRSLIGCITMLIILKKPRFTFSFNQIMAALSYSATMILFVFANKMTTSANAVLLQYVEPVYIIILGRWLLTDEKSSFIDWIVVASVFGGMILFFLDDLSFSANIGNVLAILSGISFALTAIFMRRQKNERPTDSFILAHFLTFVLSIPFMFRSGLPSGGSLTGLVLLGILQMGIPSVLYGRGISGVTAVSAALITMIEPVFNPVWVAIFYGEIPGKRAIIGGLIILGGITFRSVLKAKKM